MSFRCIKAFMHAFSGRFSRTCLEGISFNFFVCFIFNVSLGSAPKRKNFDIQRNTRVASGGQFTLNYHTPSLIDPMLYESFATVGEIRVWWRADFQSGSRVLKKVFWTFSYLYLWHTMWFHAKKLLRTLKFWKSLNSLCKSGSRPQKSPKKAQKTDHSIAIYSNFWIGMVYFGCHLVNPHVQTVQNMYGKGG